jgi:hypothetical protein
MPASWNCFNFDCSMDYKWFISLLNNNLKGLTVGFASMLISILFENPTCLLIVSKIELIADG